MNELENNIKKVGKLKSRRIRNKKKFE